MAFNPFSNNADDTSFERGGPLSHAAKSAVKTVSSQTQAQMKKMKDDATNQLLGALYGPSTPTDQAQNTDAALKSQTNTTQNATGAQSGATNKVNPNLPPEEQAKMAKVRNELFGNYSSKYKAAPNGAQNITTNLEQEIEKARKEREQKEAKRKQEAEEEERNKEEAKKAKMKEDLAFFAPKGKSTGRNRMGKPVELERAQTKTEINRGTTG